MSTTKTYYFILILLVALIISACYHYYHTKPSLSYLPLSIPCELTDLSELLISKVRDQQDIDSLLEALAEWDFAAFNKSLDNDANKYCFWINTYNAVVQSSLQKWPDSYQERAIFFNRKHINICGHLLSLDDIEHGILRKNQWGRGAGYIPKIFSTSNISQLAVQDRDYRVHFALNLGAKDSPPIGIYSPKRVNDQLNINTKWYLENVTTISEKEAIVTTPLFLWHLGDFGGLRGVREILVAYGIIDPNYHRSIDFSEYDWTLYLGNYIEL